MFEDLRCRHNVPYSHRCADCLQIGLARASGERRNSCHTVYEIAGKSCPQPTRQSAAGCDGCRYFND